jgi:hypothetical protein
VPKPEKPPAGRCRLLKGAAAVATRLAVRPPVVMTQQAALRRGTAWIAAENGAAVEARTVDRGEPYLIDLVTERR